MPTRYQRRVINRLLDTARRHAFRGAAPPEDYDRIEDEYESAKRALDRQFDRCLALDEQEIRLLKDLLYEESQVPNTDHPQRRVRGLYHKLEGIERCR